LFSAIDYESTIQINVSYPCSVARKEWEYKEKRQEMVRKNRPKQEKGAVGENGKV